MNNIYLHNLKIRVIEQFIFFTYLYSLLFFFNAQPKTYFVSLLIFIVMLIVLTLIPNINKEKIKFKSKLELFLTFLGTSIMMLLVAFTYPGPIEANTIFLGFFLYYVSELTFPISTLGIKYKKENI